MIFKNIAFFYFNFIYDILNMEVKALEFSIWRFMINSNDLILILNDYDIDGEKLIKNNPNVLAYADKNNVIRILDFLNEIGIKAKNVEKCPSILYMKTDFEVKKVWNFLVNETELEKIDVDSCLHILNS